MATPVVKRLMREAQQFTTSPHREHHAYPLECNVLEWHFTMRGPDDSPYAGGFYHGRILVPHNYPYAPPDVVLITPNGRFELEKRICLSISSYHPENWQSTWGIATVLTALRDFMSTPGNNGIGAVEYPAEVRKQLAIQSRSFVCPSCQHAISDHIAIMDAAALTLQTSAPLQQQQQQQPQQQNDDPQRPSAGDPPAAADAPPKHTSPDGENGGSPCGEPSGATSSAVDTPHDAVHANVPTVASRDAAAAASAPEAAAAAAGDAPTRRPAAMAVDRRGDHIEIRLSSKLVDKLIAFALVVIVLIALKKSLFDATRESTPLGYFVRELARSLLYSGGGGVAHLQEDL